MVSAGIGLDLGPAWKEQIAGFRLGRGLNFFWPDPKPKLGTKPDREREYKGERSGRIGERERERSKGREIKREGEERGEKMGRVGKRRMIRVRWAYFQPWIRPIVNLKLWARLGSGPLLGSSFELGQDLSEASFEPGLELLQDWISSPRLDLKPSRFEPFSRPPDNPERVV